jgi:hypothetical protein
VLSFTIAELFYKFHSFTLETLAFLVTWAVIDALIQVVRHALGSSVIEPAATIRAKK